MSILEYSSVTPQENTDIRETEEAALYGSRNADKFVVRLPKGMRQSIADVARNYHRSMNSEIVSRLETSLKAERCINGLLDDSQQDNQESVQSVLTIQEFTFIEQLRQLSNERKEALLNVVAGLNS
jgi:hypothetical protein